MSGTCDKILQAFLKIKGTFITASLALVLTDPPFFYLQQVIL